MKKNRMLRLASALLILTLLTTSVIGGTFAKYVSTGSVSDTARVAKWGVEIKTSGTLYSDAYAVAKENDDNSNLPAEWTNSESLNTISVAAGGDTNRDNIIAPGTKSYANGLSFGVSGKPEVAVTVEATIKAEDIFLAAGTYGVLVPATVSDDESLKKVMSDNTDKVYGFASSLYTKLNDSSSYNKDTKYYILTNKVEVTGNGYFPVKYKLDGNTTLTDTTATAIADEIIKKFDSSKANDKKYVANYSKVSKKFPANTDLGATGTGNLGLSGEIITWEWAYEDASITNKDVMDTLLGDMIAARDATGTPDYVIVDITTATVDGATTETVTALNYSTDDDYTVTKGTGDSASVVANLRTSFEIELTVTQVD